MHLAIRCGRRTTITLITSVLATTIGCSDAFSPSFLSLFGSSESGGLGSISTPTGHNPVLFDNEARISDSVFRFLIQGDTVVREEVVDEIQRFNPSKSDAEIAQILQNIQDEQPANLDELNLPPRVRLTVDVTNVDGGVQRLELLDGLRLVRGEELLGGSENLTDLPPALEENSGDTFIVQCDIASIEIIRIEVYTPVVVRQLNTILTENVFVEQCAAFDPPAYEVLEADVLNLVTETITFEQNYDPRRFPPALDNISCGGVLTVELTGDLTLPFKDIPNGCEPNRNPPASGRSPAFFVDNQFGQQEGLRIPGRYSVTINTRDE
jgi:hypothetical protein